MLDAPIKMELVDDAIEIGTECPHCEGTGFNKATLRLYKSFRFGRNWQHELTQDECDFLADAGRLFEFTHTYTPGSSARWEWKEPRVHPTAAEVNSWSHDGFGHDVVNQRLVTIARATRLNCYELCDACGGEGEILH